MERSTQECFREEKQKCKGPVMGTPACSVCGIVAETRQIHMDYRNRVEEKRWHSHSLKGREPRSTSTTLSREECPYAYLDRVLLLFWAHYMEDGPHLLCTGRL